MDAIPARINVTQSLRPLFKGEYRGFCFELCGQGHAVMLLTALCLIVILT
jgi:heme/copper-type cytochrome/quinol oxidase subunit 2